MPQQRAAAAEAAAAAAAAAAADVHGDTYRFEESEDHIGAVCTHIDMFPVIRVSLLLQRRRMRAIDVVQAGTAHLPAFSKSTAAVA